MIEASGSLQVFAQALPFIPATYYSTRTPYSLAVASATGPIKTTTPHIYTLIRLHTSWFKEAGTTSEERKGRNVWNVAKTSD
jgi:hypothetical protein